MLVKDLLSLGPLKLISVKPDTYIREAAQTMARYGIGLLVVLDNAGDVAGVLSERDIIKALGASETIIDYAMVGDLMTEAVVAVTPDDPLVNAVQAMGIHGIRHLVALDDGKPVGVLSIRDVLRVLAKDLIENDSDAERQLTKDLVKTLAA